MTDEFWLHEDDGKFSNRWGLKWYENIVPLKSLLINGWLVLSSSNLNIFVLRSNHTFLIKLAINFPRLYKIWSFLTIGKHFPLETLRNWWASL